jgi:hypothetical protein
LQKIFDWFFYTIRRKKSLKTIQKSIAILILLTTFLLFNCVKFKENPLDPTTPTGFLLNFIENQNNDQGNNQNQNNDQGSNQNQGYTPDKILLFRTSNTFNGNIKGTYPSARDAIDTICRNEFNNVIRVTYAGYDNIQNVRGFISIDATDYLSNYPNLYNVPTNVPIMGPNPNNTNRLVANDWADLWLPDESQNYIQNTLEDAIGLNSAWWSGSDENGNIAPEPYGFHCNHWTDNSFSENGPYGQFGSYIDTNQGWINLSGASCNATYYLLCIAW